MGVWPTIVLGILAIVGVLYGCFAGGRSMIVSLYQSSELAVDEVKTFGRRYLPVLVVLGYTLIVATIGFCLPVNQNRGVYLSFLEFYTVMHLPACLLGLFVSAFAPLSPWAVIAPLLVIYLIFTLGMARGFRMIGAPPVSRKAWLVVGVVMGGAFTGVCLAHERDEAGYNPRSA